MTAADDDWVRAGRLKKQGEARNEEAAMKLLEMENTQMYYYSDNDALVCDQPQAKEKKTSIKSLKIRGFSPLLLPFGATC